MAPYIMVMGVVQVAWKQGVSIGDQMKWDGQGSPHGAEEKIGTPLSYHQHCYD